MKLLWFICFWMCLLWQQYVGAMIFFFLWFLDVGGDDDPNR